MGGSNVKFLKIAVKMRGFCTNVVVDVGGNTGLGFFFFKPARAVPAVVCISGSLSAAHLVIIPMRHKRLCHRCTAAVTLVGLVGLGYVFVFYSIHV